MKLIHRRIILGISVILFIAVSAALVFYSMGFRFDFSNNEIEEVGILDVASFPKDIDVYIDGKLEKSTTPYQERNYTPKEYTIELTKDGYTTWKKTLPVFSRKITWVKNARIFFQDPINTELLKNVIDTQTSLDNKYIIAASKPENSNIKVSQIDTKNNQIKKEIQIPETTLNTSDIQIHNISRDANTFILTQTPPESDQKFFISNFEKIEEFIVPENKIDDIKLSTKNGDTAYFLSDNKLVKIDIESATTQIIDTDVQLFSISHENLFYAKQQQDTAEIYIRKNGTPLNFGNEETKLLTTINTKNIKSITANNFEDVAIIDANNIVTIINTDNQEEVKLNEQFTSAVFAPGSRNLLLSNEKEVYFYEIGKPSEQEFKQAYKINTLNLLTRYTNPIADTAWYSDPAWAVLHTNGSIRIIELDERDTRNIYEIKTPLANNISTNLKGDALFYTNQDNTLISSQILEK